MILRPALGRWLLVAAGVLAVGTLQAAEACVDDNLPGRLADAPVRLCVEVNEGQAAQYTLWLAGEVRAKGDEVVAREGLAGDWYGHPLLLRCTRDGALHRCALRVDGDAAWSADLPLPG